MERRRSSTGPANSAVNATVLASRRLQGKRRATRPARYRERYAAFYAARHFFREDRVTR